MTEAFGSRGCDRVEGGLSHVLLSSRLFRSVFHGERRCCEINYGKTLVIANRIILIRGRPRKSEGRDPGNSSSDKISYLSGNSFTEPAYLRACLISR